MPSIDVGGATLAYERTDTSSGAVATNARPTLILMNGIFQRIERWDPVLPFFEGYDVLRYDMRGQGRSAAPPGVYTPEVHAADLRGLVCALGIRRYFAVGLSNGGIVAQTHALAGEGARGLDGLVLVCTTPRLDPALRSRLASFRDALDAGGVALRLKVSIPWAFGAPFLAMHPELLAPDAIASGVASSPTVKAHESLLDGILSLGDLRPRLETVRLPTLVLAGQEDVLFPPSYSAEITTSIRGSELVVAKGLGHTLPLEDPRVFAAHVRRFVDANASRRLS